jgi:hypothetical protein
MRYGFIFNSFGRASLPDNMDVISSHGPLQFLRSNLALPVLVNGGAISNLMRVSLHVVIYMYIYCNFLLLSVLAYYLGRGEEVGDPNRKIILEGGGQRHIKSSKFNVFFETSKFYDETVLKSP